MKLKRIHYVHFHLIIWIVLFAFQSALEKVSSIFSYIDEAPFLLFCIDTAFRVIKNGKYRVKKDSMGYIIAIVIYVATGLLGNIIYEYQQWNLVLIDIITNLKFFGAIAFFSNLLDREEIDYRYISYIAKGLTVLITVVFVADRFINIFPWDYRYGIKSAVLFYGHPTYFAGACAFLVGILTISGNKNMPYILMDLVMVAFTLRSKAIVCVILYIALYIMIIKLHNRLQVWQIVVIGVVGVICAWSQIHFYFIQLSGASARSVMLLTSFLILKDYFPIGTGFGTYASHSAAVNYSPVYIKYGFNSIYELRNSSVGTFFDDQFWPIIFGQTGAIGTLCYIYIIAYIFKRIQRLYRKDLYAYLSGLFVLVYLLVSSIAEPAFNNSVATPLALVLAMAMKKSANEIEIAAAI